MTDDYRRDPAGCLAGTAVSTVSVTGSSLSSGGSNTGPESSVSYRSCGEQFSNRSPFFIDLWYRDPDLSVEPEELSPW